jgi:aminopeptidase N
LFNTRFGTYPFSEFDVVATPTLALGVEYPGIVAMAQRLYPPQTEYSLDYLESTMAHEVSHQWFYSVVGNDQLDEPWLDEAMAQYATLLYWTDLYGQGGYEGFRGSLESRWERVEDADIAVGMPVASYTAKEYGAIVYGRGPLFVETLANRMGVRAFDAFVKDYYQTFKWGIATTEGFKHLAESHCRCDLTSLFEEWVYP